MTESNVARCPHAASGALFDRAVKVLPGGVNSNVRLAAPRISFSGGEGAWLTDLDGRSYVDYLLGQGPAFLGHAPADVLAAVHAAAARGSLFGTTTELEVEAAERLLSAIRWAGEVRFGVTGTECVQAALRVARAVTGRARFIRFEGHYHGWLDDVLMHAREGRATPASDGQLADALATSVVVPWNDVAALRSALHAHGDEVCAVLMEPAMLNSGAIAPRRGYLEAAREMCSEFGALLIFDEVITGFRIGLGGAAERFGVVPDLAVYGKALAGGWPVAALAARDGVLAAVGTGAINHSGTFNGYLAGMAAVIATLDHLQAQPPYAEIDDFGTSMMRELKALAGGFGLPLRVQGFGQAFHVSFGPDTPIENYRDLCERDADRYHAFAEHLADHGLWVASRGIWYVSAAHGDDEFDATLERVQSAMESFS